MEGSKSNRRSRPRPLDLRRKVLLQNFLKEQMTYFPHVQLSSCDQNGDEDFSGEGSNSSELNSENNSTIVSSVDHDSVENLLSLNENEDKNERTTIESSNVNIVDPPASESKFFKFSSFINLRSGLKKKKTGILKAKKICKSIKSPVKSRSFKFGRKEANKSSSNYDTRSSSRSLFSIFKSKKQHRKSKAKKLPTVDINSNCNTDGETCTSNQSVQTDDNWGQEELSKVEESNKLLKEENKLLSESLSYFMSSNSLDSRLNHWGTPLQSAYRKMRRHTGCYDNFSSSSTYGYEFKNWNYQSRVSRSKSVYEQSSKRISSPYEYPYRTRSMNCHANRSEFYAEAASQTPVLLHETPVSQSKRKNVLTSLPVNSTGRIVQRRFSMPERTWSENDRSRICRRTGSMRDSRTPFHALPSEAFY